MIVKIQVTVYESEELATFFNVNATDVSAVHPCEAHHEVFVVNVVYPRPFLKSKNFS